MVLLIPIVDPLKGAFSPVKGQALADIILHVQLVQVNNLPPLRLTLTAILLQSAFKFCTKKVVIDIAFGLTRIGKTRNALEL